MRKNTLEVFNAWLNGKENRKQESIWTDGTYLWSYKTAVAYSSEPCECVWLNVTKYSKTTTNHVNSLRVLFERNGFEVDPVDNLWRGVLPLELQDAGLEKYRQH